MVQEESNSTSRNRADIYGNLTDDKAALNSLKKDGLFSLDTAISLYKKKII